MLLELNLRTLHIGGEYSTTELHSSLGHIPCLVFKIIHMQIHLYAEKEALGKEVKGTGETENVSLKKQTLLEKAYGIDYSHVRSLCYPFLHGVQPTLALPQCGLHLGNCF